MISQIKNNVLEDKPAEERRLLAQKRYKKTGGISTNVSIERLEKQGYCVLDLDDEGPEELKSKAPGLYEKIYEQGKDDGRAQAREHTEIVARVKAREDEAKKIVEKKRPKTLREKWDSSPELRAEFGGNFDTCESYFMNDEEFKATGNVSLSNSKDDTLLPKPTSTKTAKEIWDGDPKLRTEFSHNFKAYEMYAKS